MLRRIADYRNPKSIASFYRHRRFELFHSLLDTVPRPCHILDVGGDPEFWLRENFDPTGIHVTILNVLPVSAQSDMFTCVEGDARCMPQFGDDEFDVVFSNSVIEHVGAREQQARMAQEIRRVGRRYWVQTPNYWFPIEPHVLVPFFQYMPKTMQLWTIRRFRPGWAAASDESSQFYRDTWLLSARDMTRFFPDATIWREKVGFATKSLVAYHGFTAQ